MAGPPALPDLTHKVAVVTGASRGIGRAVALKLAERGCKVVVAAKTDGVPAPGLEGSVHTVAEEIRRTYGTPVLGVKCDLRSEKDVEKCVQAVVQKWGTVHILVNNASALWWQDIVDTPTNKFDLINSINSRGAFLMTRACLPHMLKAGWGRVITMSPPIVTNAAAFKQKTAYYMSKMGMTMVALGVASEGRKHGVTGNSLWPATIVESFASRNFELGESRAQWRKADILADCVLYLCGESNDFTGNMLIDDEYLTERCGMTQGDLARYRFDPRVEPPRLLAMEARAGDASAAAFHSGDVDFRRGDVRKLREDKARSKL